MSCLLPNTAMKVKELFMNDAFLPASQGTISVRTHAFAYGTGCFEGIRGYWNPQDQQLYLFRAREHYERLLHSCKLLHITLPYSVDQLLDITLELVRRNEQREDIYLRPVAYKAEQQIGVRLHGLGEGFLLTSEPMGNYVDTHGLHCCVSSWRRIDDNAIPARAKICGAYVNSAFAKSEAMQNGFDEAIMLTHTGHVSEGSAENLFLVEDGTLITPSRTENILEGITRATVIEVAESELGYHTCERQVNRTELYTADEVFLCGTGAQIAPVVRIDHRAVGDGHVGPVSRALQALYFAIVRGRNPKFRERWCNSVYERISTLVE